MCEEIIYNYIFKSYGDSFAPVEFTLQYSQQKDETTLQFKCELINEGVLIAAEDISKNIVSKSVKDIACKDNIISIKI